MSQADFCSLNELWKMAKTHGVDWALQKLEESPEKNPQPGLEPLIPKHQRKAPALYRDTSPTSGPTTSMQLKTAAGVQDVADPDWVVHNLDDFLLMGPTGSMACGKALLGFQQLARALGLPLATDKTEGPSTRITFLGIEIDSQTGMCRLPADKVMAFKASIESYLAGRKVTLRQLQVLVGQLNFALRVIPFR
ncbi:hypothetical protein NDU88_003670 [Pleurodeles waltl]|uniref:Reverse transcriptase domain-containing protein n=1 Tax=Pleurodeles waltl TaxID=8319 RepID=A0AAV7QCE3_PLEWA|nr:hypothetical protein NDU88_003670 [Pleurodeles waltl]